MGEKAENFARETKKSAESFAGKTFEGVEKLIKDVFHKESDVSDTEGEEAEIPKTATEPKDVEIAELKKELDELRDKYVRLYADFDNHRKRTAKEKLEFMLVASKDVINEMLPVIDDFERALKALAQSKDTTALMEGMNLIYQKLINNLASKGLKPMESIGKEFNVEMHEAITEIPVSTPEQEGKVVDEVEKGYYLNDKIIRFAKVIVGKKAE
ncbi:MAG: nucleotide exchange factor GrpE [Bacteroidetes bacterium]|nr:nucleotide exchange factor GrpE [Bacteroidota bacterium]